MVKVSLNMSVSTLSSFDKMWQTEGWESRQEAIIFLIQQALARGYISREKHDIAKSISLGDKVG